MKFREEGQGVSGLESKEKHDIGTTENVIHYPLM